VQLVERQRVPAEQKVQQSHKIGGLNRDRRNQTINGATGSYRPRVHWPGISKARTMAKFTVLRTNRTLSVVAWHHGASRSIAYWTIRHEPSRFFFAECATRNDAFALAEKIYAMFPEEFWQTNDADVVAGKLQLLNDSILKPRLRGHIGEESICNDG
jgi:hypothetical protein